MIDVVALHDEAEAVALAHVRWWRARRPRRGPRLCAAVVDAVASTWDECVDAYARAWICAGTPAAIVKRRRTMRKAA